MDKLKTLFSSRDPTFQKKWPLILLLLIIGLILVLQGREPSEQEVTTIPVSETEEEFEQIKKLENEAEKRLEAMLKKALGTNKVEVMVTLGTSEKKIFARNETTQQDQSEDQKEGFSSAADRNSMTSQLVFGNQSQQGAPVLSYIEKPAITGVMIVAENGQEAKVKKQIAEAVSKALDVSSHRVAVIPYE
ncbi:hypothetical protein [Jeotgalibacillus aurantiacus]|uniref:hypothetical protein n=1 Tax=Jeotgalibacillus aurantiacus TaxID=2763266 RepID=UPI001D09FF27|nr:hypothetical protein [Jeotgalibacillus aurantiacus]